MKILFVMLHAGFVRNYATALRELVARGHDVHLACEMERTKLNDDPLLRQVVRGGGITTSRAPVRAEGVREFLARSDRTAIRSADEASVNAVAADRWDSLATATRLVVDYLRYFEPAYAHAPKLKARAEKRLPRTFRTLADAVAACGPAVRRVATRVLAGVEAAIPVPAAIQQFVQGLSPDVVLVTPLVEFGSEQVDYVKAARRLGVPSALCVASWDNLTNKGVMRVAPDRVIVWNDPQREEAVTLHGVPPDRVSVTGAQVFDPWFDAAPSRSREEFCHRIGLPPERPFVLYVGSSSFIAPDEHQFAAAWIDGLRRAGDPLVAEAGILIRPHPANPRRWWVLDLREWRDVAIWPPIGVEQSPAEFNADYYDSLYHCAAVVGVNTSAQIEAAILGRPVCTVRAPEFAHSQQGMPHFRHLVEAGGGLLIVAQTLEEHVEQLAAAMRDPADARLRGRRFLEAFVRPFGLDRAATPIFADAVEQMGEQMGGQMARTPIARRSDSIAARLARPVLVPIASVVRLLAEDAPLWVLMLRVPLTATIRLWAAAEKGRSWIRQAAQLGVKRGRKAARVTTHEFGRWRHRTRQRVVKRGRRLTTAVSRVFSAARR